MRPITVLGFTNRSLRAQVNHLLGTEYGTNQLGYDLARLRRNGLIERNPAVTSTSSPRTANGSPYFAPKCSKHCYAHYWPRINHSGHCNYAAPSPPWTITSAAKYIQPGPASLPENS